MESPAVSVSDSQLGASGSPPVRQMASDDRFDGVGVTDIQGKHNSVTAEKEPQKVGEASTSLSMESANSRGPSVVQQSQNSAGKKEIEESLAIPRVDVGAKSTARCKNVDDASPVPDSAAPPASIIETDFGRGADSVSSKKHKRKKKVSTPGLRRYSSVSGRTITPSKRLLAPDERAEAERVATEQAEAERVAAQRAEAERAEFELAAVERAKEKRDEVVLALGGNDCVVTDSKPRPAAKRAKPNDRPSCKDSQVLDEWSNIRTLADGRCRRCVEGPSFKKGHARNCPFSTRYRSSNSNKTCPEVVEKQESHQNINPDAARQQCSASSGERHDPSDRAHDLFCPNGRLFLHNCNSARSDANTTKAEGAEPHSNVASNTSISSKAATPFCEEVARSDSDAVNCFTSSDWKGIDSKLDIADLEFTSKGCKSGDSGKSGSVPKSGRRSDNKQTDRGKEVSETVASILNGRKSRIFTAATDRATGGACGESPSGTYDTDLELWSKECETAFSKVSEIHGCHPRPDEGSDKYIVSISPSSGKRTNPTHHNDDNSNGGVTNLSLPDGQCEKGIVRSKPTDRSKDGLEKSTKKSASERMKCRKVLNSVKGSNQPKLCPESFHDTKRDVSHTQIVGLKEERKEANKREIRELKHCDQGGEEAISTENQSAPKKNCAFPGDVDQMSDVRDVTEGQSICQEKSVDQPVNVKKERSTVVTAEDDECASATCCESKTSCLEEGEEADVCGSFVGVASEIEAARLGELREEMIFVAETNTVGKDIASPVLSQAKCQSTDIDTSPLPKWKVRTAIDNFSNTRAAGIQSMASTSNIQSDSVEEVVSNVESLRVAEKSETKILIVAKDSPDGVIKQEIVGCNKVENDTRNKTKRGIECSSFEGSNAQKTPRRYACFVCRRKFRSSSMLAKHEKKSDLHKKNLAKLARKEERRKRRESMGLALSCGIKRRRRLVGFKNNAGIPFAPAGQSSDEEVKIRSSDNCQLKRGKGRITSSFKSSGPIAVWRCGNCFTMVFDTYEQAFEHETKCSRARDHSDMQVGRHSQRTGPSRKDRRQAERKERQLAEMGCKKLIEHRREIQREKSMQRTDEENRQKRQGLQLAGVGTSLVPWTKRKHFGLSDYACYLLEQIELFRADEKYNSHIEEMSEFAQLKKIKGFKVPRHRPIGAVGVRCVHCRHLKLSRRAKAAVGFPTNLASVASHVHTIASTHFPLCGDVPESFKGESARLRAIMKRDCGGKKAMGLGTFVREVASDDQLRLVETDEPFYRGLMFEDDARRHMEGSDGVEGSLREIRNLASHTGSVERRAEEADGRKNDSSGEDDGSTKVLSSCPDGVSEVAGLIDSLSTSSAWVVAGGRKRSRRALAEDDDLAPREKVPEKRKRRPANVSAALLQYIRCNCVIGLETTNQQLTGVNSVSCAFCGLALSFNSVDDETLETVILSHLDLCDSAPLSTKRTVSQLKEGSSLSMRKLIQVPFRLGTLEDETRMTPLHKMARKWIAVFTVNDSNEAEWHSQMSRSNIAVEQVGLRCVHCYLKNGDDGQPQGNFKFPDSLEEIYEIARKFVYGHFDKCPNMPDRAREEYLSIRSAACAPVQGTKDRYLQTALGLGLYDREGGGVGYMSKVSLSGRSKEEMSSFSEYDSSDDNDSLTGGASASQSSDASDFARSSSAAAAPQLLDLLDQDEQAQLLTKLKREVLKQAHLRYFSISDREHCKGRGNTPVGQPGVECSHCMQKRFFANSCDTFVKATIPRLQKHLLEDCEVFPEALRVKLRMLKEQPADTGPPKGSHWRFHVLLWGRMFKCAVKQNQLSADAAVAALPAGERHSFYN